LSSVFVLNGANLGALGTRWPEIYGTLTLGDIEGMLRERYPEVDFEFRQTDYEGEIVGYIREAKGSDGILINPGAWSHYSYAIHDALEAVESVLIAVVGAVDPLLRASASRVDGLRSGLRYGTARPST
jgi:3-dehydroquinate dehydratase II